MKTLMILLAVVSAGPALADEEAYQACRANAQAKIAEFTRSVATWSSALKDAERQIDAQRNRLSNQSKLVVDLAAVRDRTYEENQRAFAEYKRLNAQVGPAQDELDGVGVARKSQERTPELILNVRKTLEINDAQLDMRIAQLMARIEDSTNDEDKAVLKIRLNQEASLKVFRVQAGGAAQAAKLFEDYIQGTNNEAARYANPQFLPLLDSARTANLAYLAAIAALDKVERAAKSRVEALKAERERQNEILGQTYDALQDLKWRINNANVDVAIASSALDRLQPRRAEYQAGFDRESAGLASWQAEYDHGCDPKRRGPPRGGEVSGGGVRGKGGV